LAPKPWPLGVTLSMIESLLAVFSKDDAVYRVLPV